MRYFNKHRMRWRRAAVFLLGPKQRLLTSAASPGSDGGAETRCYSEVAAMIGTTVAVGTVKLLWPLVDNAVKYIMRSSNICVCSY